MKNFKLLVFFSVSTVFLFSACSKNIKYIQKKGENIDSTYVYYNKAIPYKLKTYDVLQIDISTTSKKTKEIFSSQTQTKSGGGNSQENQDGAASMQGFMINDSGYVHIPVLGDLKAEGKTVAEFKKILKIRTDEFVSDAVLKVKLINFKIRFFGEINGTQIINSETEEIEILEALSLAGGISEYGNKKKIKVIRPFKEGNKVFFIDVTKIELLESEKFYLYPNDMVIVDPRPVKVIMSNFNDITFFMTAFTTLTTTFLLFLNYKK